MASSPTSLPLDAVVSTVPIVCALSAQCSDNDTDQDPLEKPSTSIIIECLPEDSSCEIAAPIDGVCEFDETVVSPTTCSFPQWGPRALRYSLIAIVALAVIAYVLSVVYSCGPYITGTKPQVLPHEAPHASRIVWHHAANRLNRFHKFESPSPCPARDVLGVESDVQLHRGRLALHHNIFTPLFPPYWVTGTKTVRDVVAFLRHREPFIKAAFHRTVLKLDVKHLSATRLLAGFGFKDYDIDRNDMHRTLADVAALRRREGTEVWVHGDYAAHPSIAKWEFAGTPASVTAALLARYDVLSIGLKWPASMDRVAWTREALQPMVDVAVRTIAAVTDPAVLRRARITLCLRWTQLLSHDAVTAANAAVRDVTAALEAAAVALESRQSALGTVPSPVANGGEMARMAEQPAAPRVFVTVWKRYKDRAIEADDLRWLEQQLPGVTADTSGQTAVSTDCGSPRH